jgi:AbrB family looped-hinge helix DNA binding protein
MIATVSSKGQVTIPVEARKRLGLHAGSCVDFILTDDDRLEIIPVTKSVKQLKGMVPAPKKALSLDEMDRAIAKGVRK